MKRTVGVISLGCDKNRIDTEKMLYILSREFELVNETEIADVVVINTCAFLESARKEAIDEILSVAEFKKTGRLQKLIVTGCLPQKFVGDIFDELVEVDAFLGVSDYDKINEVINETFSGKRINAVGTPKGECGKKRILTTDNYVYLKIADGCSNKCTYCLIPKIRGEYRSVPLEDLIEEVKELGYVSELILVAQDVTKYGEELNPKCNLLTLIRRLSALNNVGGIRLLYCYPENITDELIHEFAVNAKMIRYIDIPFQHADDSVLKRMNRKGTGSGYLALIEKLKKEVSGIAIRSTFITGFPGESEEAFLKLINFLNRAKLFNVGFFAYSREEDTPSFRLDGQISEREKKKRLKKLYAVQKKIVKENAKELVGKIFNVVSEGFDEDNLCYCGRAYFNSPSVDGKIYFFSKDEVKTGSRVNVKITKAVDYDLYGEKT